MDIATPRLRMFAGPNGSGKSTIKAVIEPALLGIYINPDDIEKEINQLGFLDLSVYEVKTSADEIINFFHSSTFLISAGFADCMNGLCWIDNKLYFDGITINAYFASVAADFIRHKLVENQTTFTFETVMSSPDKVQFLKYAQAQGFRTYLYFIATEAPEINISRVKNRVIQGGHPVPEDKIVSRYYRSLDLLADAVQFTDRAYIFDNSFHSKVWLAEITEGKMLEMKTDTMPHWFKIALWDKFFPN
jgi:predicted ABC-type ATPase